MSPDVAHHLDRQADEDYEYDPALVNECEACGDEMTSPWLMVCRRCAEFDADQEAARAYREGRY